MKRREFISLIGGATAWPFAAHAQPAGPPVVGFLNAASERNYRPFTAAFVWGLKQAGYVDGLNVSIAYRWAEEQNDRLPALAADLVNQQVAVIAATSTPAALAAKAATNSIPIVFEFASDPVALGLVASLNRPGGNITGITQTNMEVSPKRLQLLTEVVPAARAMALLVNPSNPVSAEKERRELSETARALGLQLHILEVTREDQFELAIEQAKRAGAGGLVIATGDPLFVSYNERLATLALRSGLPTAFAGERFLMAGGLITYGADIGEAYRLTGVYVGRVLKGEKPSDLPVQQATKIELRINLKTAKALGLTVPLALLGRADEVIE